MKKLIVLMMVVMGITSCNLPNQEKSVEYVKSITTGNTEKLLEETDNKMFEVTPKDSLIAFNERLKTSFDNIFGNDPEINCISANVSVKLGEEKQETAIVEISNGIHFADIEIRFNPETGKVSGYNVSKIYKVPSKAKFWIACAIGLLLWVLVIFTIVRIKRSDMKKKWLNYIFVVLFNFPTLIIEPASTNLQLLKLQLMSFGCTAPSNHYKVELALPIASIIILIMLVRKKKKNDEDVVK